MDSSRSQHFAGWPIRAHRSPCSNATAPYLLRLGRSAHPLLACVAHSPLHISLESPYEIARELIYRKLVGQERLVRERLNDPSTADRILQFRVALAEAETVLSVRQLESQAAQAYWSAWRNLPVQFPSADLPRVPDHWRTFGTRKSPLTGSPRLAVNPPNAILNYLYAILEAEARLAASALGLDPGIGVLHVDTDARDSLACDLMEPIRPQIDAYLLDWITREPLRKQWFFEKRDGNCRLMAPF